LAGLLGGAMPRAVVAVTLAALSAATTALAASEDDEPAAPPAPPAAAEHRDGPGEAVDALPGALTTPIAAPAARPWAVAATLDYGAYPRIPGTGGRTRRLGGRVSAAWTPIAPLSFGASLLGVAGHSTLPNGHADSSYYGEPQLVARAQSELLPGLFLGAQADFRLVGERAPSIDLNATTSTLEGLVGWHAAPRTWLGGGLGYRVDRTSQAMEDSGRLRPGDRLLLDASTWDAMVFQVGATQGVGPVELLAELDAELLFGRAAPPIEETPWSFGLGARYALTQDSTVQLGAEFSGAKVPHPYPTESLFPLRPRVLLLLGWTVRFGSTSQATAERSDAEPQSKPLSPRPAAPPSRGSLLGRVVDEGGRPMTDVTVTLSTAGHELRQCHTDADGHFRFDDVSIGRATLTTDTVGYDPAKRDVALEAPTTEAGELVIYPALPAGEVKGRALDPQGKPVAATITVQPGGQSFQAAADGSFSIDLKPGSYALTFTHPDYAPQTRTVKVEERGVVVLDLALEH